MSKLYINDSFMGDKYDTTIYTNGGTYHKVVVEDAEEGGIVETRKFFDRFKARQFARMTAEYGYFEKQEKKLAVAGHKLETHRSGPDDSYWNGRCQCGWVYPSWTTKKGTVVDSHQSHLMHVEE